MRGLILRPLAAITALSLVTIGFMLSGCSGGGGLSSQVVSGTASVGAPLGGQVSLKDSSNTPLLAAWRESGSPVSISLQA